MGVFPDSVSEVISLLCPQKDGYVLSASPNLEFLMAQVLQMSVIYVITAFRKNFTCKKIWLVLTVPSAFLDECWPAVINPGGAGHDY